MTLNEIAYQVAEAAGLADNDTFIERAKAGVAYYRALLVRRELDKNGRTHPTFYQSIVANLERAKPTDACLADFNCQVLRTSQKIPSPIRIKGHQAPFLYVGTVDNRFAFLYNEMHVLPLMRHNKYTKNLPTYSYSDGYLYFINVPYEAIAIRGIFEDPLKLKSFKVCDGESQCSSADDEYPVPLDMVPLIVQSMLAGEFGTSAANDEQVEEVEINK